MRRRRLRRQASGIAADAAVAKPRTPRKKPEAVVAVAEQPPHAPARKAAARKPKAAPAVEVTAIGSTDLPAKKTTQRKKAEKSGDA